jgi:hypothetical protein
VAGLIHRAALKSEGISQEALAGQRSAPWSCTWRPRGGGGPLAVVRNGDPIVLDVHAGRLDLDIGADELRRRLQAFRLPAPVYRRGYGALYLEHVMQADRGCDFDFLIRRDRVPVDTEPLGLFTGAIGGW